MRLQKHQITKQNQYQVPTTRQNTDGMTQIIQNIGVRPDASKESAASAASVMSIS